jgi:hypothetical protein
MRMPIISRETSLMALADLLREELLNPSDGAGCLMNAVTDILRENPNLVAAVDVMMVDESSERYSAALIGMLLTYRAIKAQLEVDALEGMAA